MRPSFVGLVRAFGGLREPSTGSSVHAFLRNDRVSVAEMASHAASRTAERVAGREIIVVQDTSELILGGRRAKANGYGPVGKGGGTRGLLVHAALALDADNDALLGLVDAQVWNRTRAR